MARFLLLCEMIRDLRVVRFYIPDQTAEEAARLEIRSRKSRHKLYRAIEHLRRMG